MEVNVGLEGQLKINPLLLFAKENAIPRDAPRLKTIQRIYDRDAIGKLVSSFKRKALEVNVPWVEELKELEQVK